MPENTRTPLSIFFGQRSRVRLVSRSHGIVRPSLMDTLDVTPKFSNKRIDEFDNPVSALTYTTFDGASGKIGYTASNQDQLESMLMDIDPTVATGMVNPADFKPFQLFSNVGGQDGKIKKSMLVYACDPMANPWNQPVKEGAKKSIDFESLNGLTFNGLALQYTRARSTDVLDDPPAEPVVATASVGGFIAGGQTVYVQITGVTALGETTVSNEAAIHIPTGTDTNLVNVTIPALVGGILSYNVYVFNRSNDERFSVNAAPGTEPILQLPAATAAKPPRQNTSGVFAAAGDKVFTGSGPWVVTLDNAAFELPQTGLDYAMVMRDGEIVATVDNPADNGDFLFSADGLTFSVDEDPAGHVWEIFTLYQP